MILWRANWPREKKEDEAGVLQRYTVDAATGLQSSGASPTTLGVPVTGGRLDDAICLSSDIVIDSSICRRALRTKVPFARMLVVNKQRQGVLRTPSRIEPATLVLGRTERCCRLEQTVLGARRGNESVAFPARWSQMPPDMPPGRVRCGEDISVTRGGERPEVHLRYRVNLSLTHKYASPKGGTVVQEAGGIKSAEASPS
ncbi:hypothetical protein GGR56DRAFT_126245 [Xylariaceae sp. FL0804]|nr:hypothetical protein GGR56DRAFT_126245 [Xylariaceae sp. FL0804]